MMSMVMTLMMMMTMLTLVQAQGDLQPRDPAGAHPAVAGHVHQVDQVPARGILLGAERGLAFTLFSQKG